MTTPLTTGGQKEEQRIPPEELKRIESDAVEYWRPITFKDRPNIQQIYTDAAKVEYLRAQKQLSEKREGPVWVKGSEVKPADGIKNQLLHIRPFKKHHNYDFFEKTYIALIWMGDHDGGAKWHRYEGPNSGWHTKIVVEDWDKIEYLDESPSLTRDGEREEGERKYSLEELKELWEAAETWAIRGPYSKNHRGEIIRSNPDFETYIKSKLLSQAL